MKARRNGAAWDSVLSTPVAVGLVYRCPRPSWLNALRLEITCKQYDKALANIAAARKVAPTKPPTPASRFDLWEALVRARQGDFATADRLYMQIADDPQAEALARGLALVNLVNVRHAEKDGPGLDLALDRLTAMFPELNAPNPFSSSETIQWYRNQARQFSPVNKTHGPSGEPSRLGRVENQK